MAIETRKFSEFTDAGDLAPNQDTVGVNAGVNAQYNNPFPLLPPGTTGDRPAIAASMYYRLRFNTTIESYEYYSPVTMTWIQIEDSGDLVDGPFVIYKAAPDLGAAFNLGTLTSGLLKQSVSLGVSTPEIAVLDTDYYGPGMTGPLRFPSGVVDNLGLNIVGFLTTGLGSVNYLTFQNNTTLNPPALQSAGSDFDIGITYKTKNAGEHSFHTTASTAAINFFTGTGYQRASNFNFSDTAATYDYTWPDASGTIALTSGASGIVNPGLINQLGYYAAAGSTISGLTGANQAALTTDGTGVLTWVPMIAGQILIGTTAGAPVAAAINSGTNITVANGSGSITVNLSGIVAPTLGGTGVNNGTNTLTLAGNLATVGAFASTFTMTGVTGVTFPTSGTLATTSQLPTPSALTKTDDTNVTLTLGGSPSVALLAATSLTLGWTGILSKARGGTSVSSATIAPASLEFAAWDTNLNMSANNFLGGFATTVSAGATTTLTVASAANQELTGTLTQTYQMPVASTLVAGTTYKIINNSSGAATVNSSGGNLILTMAANTTAFFTLVLASGTSAASWNSSYIFDLGGGVTSITGTANQVIASASTGNVVLSTPQDIATSSSPTFVNLILTGAAIQFTGGLNMLAFGSVASAVNYASLNNAATGFGPSLGMSGTDPNIPWTMATKGTGVMTFNSAATSNQFNFGSGTSLVHTSIFNFPVTSASRTYTWPDTSGTVALTAGSGGLKSFQILTSGTAATYTRPAGITSILVEAVGGGGGGGGAAISTGGGAAGGGGASGGYCRLWVAAAAATYTYTVGAGGAGGTAGNNNGSAGTSTTFVGTGANIAAALGSGGVGSANSTSSAFRGAGGSPGSSSGGDVNINGATGNYGYTTNAAGTGFSVGGYGGNSYFGGGGVFNPAVATGSDAVTNSGGGGSGGSATNNGSAFAGGAGAAGIIIVWEFA